MEYGWPVGACAGGLCRIGPAGGGCGVGDIEPGSRLLQVDSSHSVPALVAAGRDSDAAVRQGIVAAVGEWGGAAVSP